MEIFKYNMTERHLVTQNCSTAISHCPGKWLPSSNTSIWIFPRADVRAFHRDRTAFTGQRRKKGFPSSYRQCVLCTAPLPKPKTLLDKAIQSWGGRATTPPWKVEGLWLAKLNDYKIYFSSSAETRILITQPSEQMFLNSFKKNIIYWISLSPPLPLCVWVLIRYSCNST